MLGATVTPYTKNVFSRQFFELHLVFCIFVDKNTSESQSVDAFWSSRSSFCAWCRKKYEREFLFL